MMRGLGKLLLILVAFLLSPTACLGEGEGEAKLTPTESEALFLDRLMRAESGGRPYAKNTASSALGPFQFIESTFLDVVRRNFPALASGKTDADILALRTDVKISADVALIYTRENASTLGVKGIEATAANLRLENGINNLPIRPLAGIRGGKGPETAFSLMGGYAKGPNRD